MTNEKCPRCRLTKDMDYPALSRRDNKTDICDDCGQEEAMVDAGLERGSEAMEREAKFKSWIWT